MCWISQLQHQPRTWSISDDGPMNFKLWHRNFAYSSRNVHREGEGENVRNLALILDLMRSGFEIKQHCNLKRCVGKADNWPVSFPNLIQVAPLTLRNGPCKIVPKPCCKNYCHWSNHQWLSRALADCVEIWHAGHEIAKIHFRSNPRR